MATIRSYPLAAPTLNDTVLGVQYVQNQEPATKQYGISEIIALAEIPEPNPYAPPYYVYTALLTQSGVNGPDILSDSDLTIGVTYEINTGSTGPFDFTNVGAPNNDIGTYFVATGTTPNDWASALLNYNTGAPVATVLENTIGNVWYTYDDVGTYSVHSNGVFATDKTTVSTDAWIQNNQDAKMAYGPVSPLSFTIYTSKGPLSDDYLSNARLEIKLYKPST
jgi:hypothetical protein